MKKSQPYRCSVGLILVGLLLSLGCTQRIDERNWVTMGTTASVKVKGFGLPGYQKLLTDRAVVTAQMQAAAIEKLLNAHDPESELSKAAVLPDDQVVARFADLTGKLPIFPKTDVCVTAAFRLRDQSDGVFNPRWKGPETLDLGAIAKGYAVDVIAQIYVGDGVKTLFDIGGNLKCQYGSWKVGIAGTEQMIVLTNGMACATSGEYFRGKHIIDARTGNAVTNDLYSVTIVHPSSAMLADGLSTICFILGEEKGEAFLRKHYPEAKAIWIHK